MSTRKPISITKLDMKTSKVNCVFCPFGLGVNSADLGICKSKTGMHTKTKDCPLAQVIYKYQHHPKNTVIL